MATHSRKTPADPNLALRIELAMRRKGLTVTDLATAVGRSVGAVSHWINERYEPPRSMIPKLTEALGVSPGWLMGENLTEEEREIEERYLRRIQEGGRELADLLDSIPLNDLLAHLRKYRPRKQKIGKKKV